ncbi:MAG: hypothetical protein ABIZ70_08190 [Gemmatimonadales bacterium]
MRRAALVIAGALLGFTAPVAAQAPSRWAVQIQSPVGSERGELRLTGRTGRLLLESSDTAWITVRDLQLVDGHITFAAAPIGRRFEGVVASGAMQGTVTEADGRTTRWIAEEIPAGIVRWPVRPRVRLRQVVVGTGLTHVAVPAAWRALIPTAATIAAERDALAAAVGLRPPTVDAMLNAQRVSLGFDSVGRALSYALLLRIANGPAANDEFRRIFGVAPRLRIDLHQVAFALAENKRNRPPTPADALARSLATLAPGFPVATDSISLFGAGWRAWNQARTDTLDGRIVAGERTVPDARFEPSVRGLLEAYDDATVWWTDAVNWLLNNAWIETAAGYRSPAALVAAFWGKATVPSPPLEPTHFGSVQAVPVVGAARLGSRLIRPLNASGAEWLTQGGLATALGLWRDIEDHDSLTVVRDGQSMQLTGPAAVARSRLGGFLSGRDAIRMEPAISPIFAVVTAVHEWQHLLFEGARLEGNAPGLLDTPEELTLLDGNPWLAEGAAEWATEAVLAPARGSTPLLAYMEAFKRGSIDLMTGGDDPHALGYLLVRALATRSANPALLRDRLIRLLHDPVALAREYQVDGPARGVQPIQLNRPSGAGVIPEIDFTWDDGVAEHLVRRLVIPAHPQEH